jgi:hypothetical protein
MKKIILIIAIICLYGCEEKTTPQQITIEHSNEDFNVELLFEVDSIKVYRFYDGGRPVYFSKSQGRFDYTYTRRAGKVTTHHTQTTLTN